MRAEKARGDTAKAEIKSHKAPKSTIPNIAFFKAFLAFSVAVTFSVGTPSCTNSGRIETGEKPSVKKVQKQEKIPAFESGTRHKPPPEQLSKDIKPQGPPLPSIAKIKENMQPPSISLYSGSANFLSVGDTHTENASKKLFFDSLEKLKEEGFNYLLIEPIHEAYQNQLDEFYNISIEYQMARQNGAPERILKSYVERMYQQKKTIYNSVRVSLKCPDETAKDDTAMIIKALFLGIRVISVSPSSHYDTYDEKSKAIAETSLEIFGKNPDAKVIFYGGMLHAMDSGIPSILKEIAGNESKMEINSSSIVFLGVEPDFKVAGPLGPTIELETAIRNSELARESFSFPIKGEAIGEIPFDAAVFMPITEPLTLFSDCN